MLTFETFPKTSPSVILDNFDLVVVVAGLTGAEVFLTAMEISIVKMNSYCQDLIAIYFSICVFAFSVGFIFSKRTVNTGQYY